MAERRMITVDGNEATASVAHRTNEVIAIYPITPSSDMGEHADAWSADGRKNIWGTVPRVVEMQSEAGAAGAVHGALQNGALTTTFTASQGLLLKIPNMYKIAGELTSFCMHVSARTIATHALSIFGDHSDVMAARQTGFAMLSSGSGQMAHDFACIGQAATLKSRVPVLHFFDGFRTSHEVTKLEELTNEDLLAMIDPELVAAHRKRALSSDHPVIRGTAQNPDTFFQMQEARNLFYTAAPEIMQETMDKFARLTGRQYKLFEYFGAPDAERIVIIMGSGGETVHETVNALVKRGEKVGVLKVRLYRPFSLDHFIAALPVSVKAIAVLDRTKELGALGEPLYLDIMSAFFQAKQSGVRAAAADPVVIGGRYGLSSKEFNASMAKAVFDELKKDKPKMHFTVGITDDVTGLSLTPDLSFNAELEGVKRAVFFGLGADGTVGANKNSIKIIAENTDNYAQGYFVYDSKKAGAMTISHLRFSPKPIQSPYLIDQAQFVACHQFSFVEKRDMLKYAAPGATFLLNTPYGEDEIWDHLPRSVQEALIDKKLKFFVINADKVASETGMGRRINTVMQTCFFAISGVLPRDEAIKQIKKYIDKTYGIKGKEIVQLNYKAVDATLVNLHEVKVPAQATANYDRAPLVPDDAPDFVRNVTARLLEFEGDFVPVSAFPVDGTWPTGTTQWDKRNIALEIPVWERDLCIQCNKCALVCPHAAIRAKVYEAGELKNAPSTFKAMDYKGKEFGEGAKYTIQVAPEDCTGCQLCVQVCPGKDKKDPERRSLVMVAQPPLREKERDNWEFFLKLSNPDRSKLRANVKMSQFAEPLFQFSGACAACGETPYIKLMTQLYGDRALIANTTGCSSIYGGNLPTHPYTTNCEGRGPAWANSLFEDNAEFGLGFRLAVDKHHQQACEILVRMSDKLGADFVQEMVKANQSDEAGIAAQRGRLEVLRKKLAAIHTPEARWLENIAEFLVKRSVWIVGGDGWAYDIGYGGLDHVLASGNNVNVLVMDTEVYSNTGGQASKATNLAAAAKFAMAGKSQPKKDLGLISVSYGNIYVASVALGASDAQTVRAFQEAESYDGPSIIIAYSPCGEHGFELLDGARHQKLAVDSGYWLLYRYDPRKLGTGEKPLTIDSKMPSISLDDFLSTENRFQIIRRKNPERYKALVADAEYEIRRRRTVYEKLAEVSMPAVAVPTEAAE
ncbi:pyruvate:ferredoxin (flavodoxin) oxidoreductase [Shumkonia mesophila]|uniref:pyruvate:ferredoxin (flavodoxin) oxidoreductase n=1 Tax=Shumkonia mesophila TaxID=2838854 RepID=UPI002934FECD|nr:pyruvate:ferredoxin (flavodoxin) oxidoreductase [Shumkonia mesophila]